MMIQNCFPKMREQNYIEEECDSHRMKNFKYYNSQMLINAIFVARFINEEFSVNFLCVIWSFFPRANPMAS